MEGKLAAGWEVVMWLLLRAILVSSFPRPRSLCRRLRPLLLLLLGNSSSTGSVARDRRGGADFSILIYHSFLATLGEKWAADVSSDIFSYLLLCSRTAPLDALLHYSSMPPTDGRTHMQDLHSTIVDVVVVGVLGGQAHLLYGCLRDCVFCLSARLEYVYMVVSSNPTTAIGVYGVFNQYGRKRLLNCRM